MEWTMFEMQQSKRPPRNREENGLYKASGDLKERGLYEGHTSESSLYTKASLHPATAAALVLGVAGLALAALWRPWQTGGANGQTTTQ
jgi:hypothetical protein